MEPDPTGAGEHPRVAIVTGGAGGIGSVLSAMLAEHGYAVVVADVDDIEAKRVAAGLPGPVGAAHLGFAGDLTSTETNRDLVAAAAAIGTITVLVNAVGISPKADGRKRPFAEISEQEWDRVMAVNLKAPFLLVQQAHRLMPTDGTASVVNLLSITAKIGSGGSPDAPFPPFLPSSAAYAASKAALQNLTSSLARELADLRIRVNGIAPGFIQTAMTGSAPDRERLLSQVPLGRFGRPDELVGAVEFLVSDRAGYITGASIDINGGWLTC